MTHLKRFATLLLHLCTMVLTQLSLLHLVLKETDPSLAKVLAHVLPAALFCVLDLMISCLFMQNEKPGRPASIALHFGDLVLAFPALILAFFGIISGGIGAAFAACVLLLDLLLVIDRSTVFVLTGPAKKK